MEPLIYKKMSAVMRDIGSIAKNQENREQKFKFRGIDQFLNALHPALIKSGVFMSPRVTRYGLSLREVTRLSGKIGVDRHVEILIEYDFFAEDGSKVTVGPIASEGLDSGDKATNKALSTALKYALIQTFSIPTEDMEEPDSESPELGTEKRESPTNPQPKVVANKPAKVVEPPIKPAFQKVQEKVAQEIGKRKADPVGSATIHFGKNKGKALWELNDRQLDWYYENALKQTKRSQEDEELIANIQLERENRHPSANGPTESPAALDHEFGPPPIEFDPDEQIPF